MSDTARKSEEPVSHASRPDLSIVGADVRAAAFSALRAGFQPWCLDLFGDTDLRMCCSARVIPAAEYPDGLVTMQRSVPPGPWFYTGALENRPLLIDQIARERPLWGMGADALRLVRDPHFVHRVLIENDLPALRVVNDPPDNFGWLVKPVDSAGGAGIQHWENADRIAKRRVYFQEFVDGSPCAALFVGRRGCARLLGISRQIIGAAWCRSGGFRYCGSIGPFDAGETARRLLVQIGEALAERCNLTGLFGIDFILRDDVPWTVEINPRYTASVEVLEYALGIDAVRLHAECFGATVPPNYEPLAFPRHGVGAVVGKAILFARDRLTFPTDGPWLDDLRVASPWSSIPRYADIPEAGTTIEPGKPICTLFATATNETDCRAKLQSHAEALDLRLFGR